MISNFTVRKSYVSELLNSYILLALAEYAGLHGSGLL